MDDFIYKSVEGSNVALQDLFLSGVESIANITA